MHLSAGDTPELESEGERITLRPVRPRATGIRSLICRGERVDVSITGRMDGEREKRLRELLR